MKKRDPERFIGFDFKTQIKKRLGSKAKLEIFSRCKSHLDEADLPLCPKCGDRVFILEQWR